MKKFEFTDSLKDHYIIYISSTINTLFVESTTRIRSIVDIDGDTSYYVKTIFNYNNRKNLEYNLDNVELIKFICKLLNNKAFW